MVRGLRRGVLWVLAGSLAVSTLLSAGCGASDAGAGDVQDVGPGDLDSANDARDAADLDAAPEPWPWPTCERLRAGSLRLVDKAAWLDALVPAQHLGDGLLRTIRQRPDGDTMDHQPSTGLWTGMYLASQAFRYAVTGDPEAQDNAAVAVAALHDLAAVTGVPGLYGRAYQRPEAAYAYTFDGSTSPSWEASPTPGYEGWWYSHEVSKDTMDGIVFGYAAALEHLDDPALQAQIRADLTAFVQPFVAHGLRILTGEGVPTEHGKLFYGALDDFPGFNALLSLSWLQTAIAANASAGQPDAALVHFYDDCLLRLGDRSDCPTLDPVDLGSYLDVIETWLHVYRSGCLTSYDNIDMIFHALYPLLRREQRAALRQRLLAVLEVGVWRPEPGNDEPPLYRSTHALYTLLYGALAQPSPDDPVFRQALDEGVCTLFELPRDRHDRDVAAGDQPVACTNRLDHPNAATVIPLLERNFDNYVWRLDPYEIPEAHAAVAELVYSPEDFLLAYWAGRYHGFLPPDL